MSDIAIIGMAGRFPGADTIEQFWTNLTGGVESIRHFTPDELQGYVAPELLADPAFVPAKGTVAGIDRFDAAFFGIPPREAELLDPQQRFWLECAWEALESAGWDPARFPGRIGVYGGVGFPAYLFANLMPHRERLDAFELFLTNDKDFVATRVAYKLGLTGTAVTVQTACSTSLVAVHLACQALLNGEVDMALAGGATIRTPEKGGYLYREGSILSPDGHCRPFDAAARGTVPGDGAAVVLLKRLEEALADGDVIHAVIRGTAANNDGAVKAGYTAPSAAGQAEVIAEAMAAAGVEPDSIGYIEAHGTGTPLGDPIELEGLTRAFRAGGAEGRQFCAIGSAKSNLGHLDTAAGVAGLVKAALCLKHGAIPPTLHLQAPNPKWDWAASPFYPADRLRPWQPGGGAPRRAGVSSFGIGGTNAHAVLEEAPAREEPAPAHRSWQLLPVSARTPGALERAGANLAACLQGRGERGDLADVAYTLQTGRRAFDHRRAVVARTAGEAADLLRSADGGPPAGELLRFAADPTTAIPDRPVAFLFPGQGAQYPGMARELYHTEPVFRTWVDRCAELLAPHLGCDIRTVIHDGDELEQTWLTQPALFTVEYALARLWMDWGLTPRAMLGHSVGEYVAACLAGVFRLEDALALVAARGRLIWRLPRGAMLAVALPEADMVPLLGDALSLAAVNGPSACVAAGPAEAVAALQARLEAREVDCRRLHTSHAFHSAMLDPILAEFEARVRLVPLHAPQLPYISNVTGGWINPADATDPAYWVRHLRQTVRFEQGLALLLAEPELALLEVGPGQTLTALAQRHPGRQYAQPAFASLPHPRHGVPADAHLLGALGRLWSCGVTVDWTAFWEGERRLRVELPTYPFERQRYWVDGPLQQAPAEPGALARSVVAATPASDAPQGEIEEAVTEVWTQLLGITRIGRHDDFFAIGGDSLVASRVLARLRKLFGVEVPLSALFERPTTARLSELIEDLLLDALDQ